MNESKQAKLEALGIEVPLGLNTYYHDDGFVRSIDRHLYDLAERYQYTSLELPELVGGQIARGACSLIYDSNFRRHRHIYYIDSGFEPLNLEVRAHEETHALEDLGALDLLATKILDEQKVKINFNDIRDSEVRAHIGSIYALFANRLHPNRLNEHFLNLDLEIAMVLYEQSRLPK